MLDSIPGFDSLSDAEILALTDEQIRYYLDIECAKDGVPFLPADPGLAPVTPKAERDVSIYSVTDMHFASLEDAQRVAELATRCPRLKKDYAPGGNYDHHIGRPQGDPVDISTETVFSVDAWDRQKAALQAYAQTETTHRRNTSEREKIAKRRGEVTDWITTKIENVRDRQSQRERCAREMARYVELARGDEDMARAFFLKANPEDAQYLPPVEDKCLPASPA